MTGGESPPTRPVPSERFHRVLAFASDEADGLGHGYVTCQHLMYALASERRGIASAVFDRVGITPEALHELIAEGEASHDRIGQSHLDLAREVEETITRAVAAADDWQDRTLDTEHLLYGLLTGQNSSDELLSSLHAKPQLLLDELLNLRTSAPPKVVREEAIHAYRLTVESAWVLGLAADHARQHSAREINTLHLLVALMAVDAAVRTALTETLAVDERAINAGIHHSGRDMPSEQRPPLADEVQIVLGFAIGQAWNRSHLAVTPIHIAMGIARTPMCKASDLLADNQVSQADFIEAIEAIMPQSQTR